MVFLSETMFLPLGNLTFGRYHIWFYGNLFVSLNSSLDEVPQQQPRQVQGPKGFNETYLLVVSRESVNKVLYGPINLPFSGGK